MLLNLKRWLVVVLLVLSLGTPWTLLQSLAWVGMLVKYSQSNTFVQAVNFTFDGKHPCRLCHYVQEGQTKERQQQKQTVEPEKKLELALPPEVFAVFHPSPTCAHASVMVLHEARQEAPPSPPPRPA